MVLMSNATIGFFQISVKQYSDNTALVFLFVSYEPLHFPKFKGAYFFQIPVQK